MNLESERVDGTFLRHASGLRFSGFFNFFSFETVLSQACRVFIYLEISLSKHLYQRCITWSSWSVNVSEDPTIMFSNYFGSVLVLWTEFTFVVSIYFFFTTGR